MKLAYVGRDDANALYRTYDDILRTVVGMINHPESWIITDKSKRIEEEMPPYGDPFP